jgi:hypothetical protein
LINCLPYNGGSNTREIVGSVRSIVMRKWAKYIV